MRIKAFGDLPYLVAAEKIHKSFHSVSSFLFSYPKHQIILILNILAFILFVWSFLSFRKICTWNSELFSIKCWIGSRVFYSFVLTVFSISLYRCILYICVAVVVLFTRFAERTFQANNNNDLSTADYQHFFLFHFIAALIFHSQRTI